LSRNLHSPGSSNRSANQTFDEVVRARRALLKGGLGLAIAAALPGCATHAPPRRLGFTPIAPSSEDSLRVPPEYEARVLFRWGDPVGASAGMPEFRMDASNSAADQALQAGMHHDGMHYFPLRGSEHGLLAMNHEYLDEGLLFPDGQAAWSAEKVLKAQHAVGVSVIEVVLKEGRWQVVRPSKYARRVTARTPCRISGPAGGHALMRTAADAQGRTVLGTYNGCAHGWTPWGTYLTCEENWHVNFVQRGAPSPEQRRYGIGRGRGYRWEEYDPRFNAALHPNEPNRFGWIVEIDPFDPASVPVKRTALGRIKHEGAASTVARDGRVAFYMGDDEPFEYIYKFVTARAYDGADRAANRDLMDSGILYVARFNADGSGEWLPLQGPDQGAVVVNTRLAADAAGATRMDRAEWIVPHPQTREVYAALTGGSGRKDADAANPRAPNRFGHIVRWREDGDDAAATRFRWDVFVLAGPQGQGDIQGDAFASPDGLWFDSLGTLWVQTDMSPTSMGRGDFAPLGNNQALAVDPVTRVFRRFLTGPRGCEITGFHTTPDNRSAFVNIQHPGETPGDRSNPQNPRAYSNWPDYAPDGRPRSATVAIRRRDGGVIGT
jgi:uncharacterized protein